MGGPIPLFLPFMEQTAVYESIDNAVITKGTSDGNRGATMLPATNVKIPGLFCPSDGASGLWQESQHSMWSNYVPCYGDVMGVDAMSWGDYYVSRGGARGPRPRSWIENGAGNFTTGYTTRTIGEITDGLSNTIGWGEHCIFDGDTTKYKSMCLQVPVVAWASASAGSGWSGVSGPPNAILTYKGSGGRFSSASPPLCDKPGGDDVRSNLDRWRQGRGAVGALGPSSGFNALLPPNSPSTMHSSWSGGLMSATSSHTGGIQVSFLDGTVHFITDEVNVEHLDWGCVEESQGINTYKWGGYQPRTLIKRAGSVPHPEDGQPFHYGLWSLLGAINDGCPVQVP
jgi:hypothetical protein